MGRSYKHGKTHRVRLLDDDLLDNEIFFRKEGLKNGLWMMIYFPIRDFIAYLLFRSNNFTYSPATDRFSG